MATSISTPKNLNQPTQMRGMYSSMIDGLQAVNTSVDSVSSALSTETAARVADVAALNASLSSLTTALNTEITDRAAADSTLTANLNTEISNRTAGDASTLSSAQTYANDRTPRRFWAYARWTVTTDGGSNINTFSLSDNYGAGTAFGYSGARFTIDFADQGGTNYPAFNTMTSPGNVYVSQRIFNRVDLTIEAPAANRSYGGILMVFSRT